MFLVVLRRSGPQWDPSRPLEEQSDWPAHASFMDGLVDAGFVVLGGPLADEHRVAHVVEAASEAVAPSCRRGRRRWPRFLVSGEDADFVQRAAQFGGVAVDAEGARTGELVLAVTAAEQADAEHAGAAGGEQIPDGVADDVAVGGRDAEPLGAGEKEIRFRFRPVDLAAL